MDLPATTAFVPGASRGLGKHLAGQLTRRGDRGHRGARKPEALDTSTGVTPVPPDTTDPASVTVAAAAIGGEFILHTPYLLPAGHCARRDHPGRDDELCGQPDAARIRKRSCADDDGYKRSDDMTVDRTQVGYETRYTLHDGAALSCMLTFGADEISAPAEWNIVLPGTDGSSHRHVMHRFTAPVAVRLRAWLAPIIGADRATELAAAVGARPPRPPGGQRQTPAVARSIPRQRDPGV